MRVSPCIWLTIVLNLLLGVVNSSPFHFSEHGVRTPHQSQFYNRHPQSSALQAAIGDSDSDVSGDNSSKAVADIVGINQVSDDLKRTGIGFAAGMCFTLIATRLYTAAFGGGIFETADDIPGKLIREQKEINAVVVKISDGDTFRVRHVTKFHGDPTFSGKLTEHTIPVRIAAVDTPETAKFGNTGQPLAVEAKEFVHQRLMGQRIKIQLLSKDQYSRVVGLVRFKDQSGWRLPIIGTYPEKDISEELLKEGLAVVYRQGGAQYGARGASFWDDLEQRAQSRKKGIWAQGVAAAQLPSEYKKNAKQKTPAAVGSAKRKQQTPAPTKGTFSPI